MSRDLPCGCSVGSTSGIPHYVCPAHLRIEREHDLNPIFPADWPLDLSNPDPDSPDS